MYCLHRKNEFSPLNSCRRNLKVGIFVSCENYLEPCTSTSDILEELNQVLNSSK